VTSAPPKVFSARLVVAACHPAVVIALAAFGGALLGSFLSYAAALLARGTALETDLRELATDLHNQVREQTVSVEGAAALLEALRPRVRWWKFGRAKRVNESVDKWLDLFDDAQLRSGLLSSDLESSYPVPEDDEPEGLQP
jgi:hypothetical protein